MQARATFDVLRYVYKGLTRFFVFCFKVPYVLRDHQHGRFRAMSISRAYRGKRGLYLIKNGILYKDQWSTFRLGEL
jgi:hypothetical protein